MERRVGTDRLVNLLVHFLEIVCADIGLLVFRKLERILLVLTLILVSEDGDAVDLGPDPTGRKWMELGLNDR